LDEVGPNAIFVFQPNAIAYGWGANGNVLDDAGNVVGLGDFPIPNPLANGVEGQDS
jgi:hypothetical protein